MHEIHVSDLPEGLSARGPTMRLAIMQPYFMPYIGYWQLLACVDRFVIYDNIQYTKKGWINRNRFLQNGKDAFFTIPVKKDSDFLDVAQRSVADDFDRERLLRQLAGSYAKAPQFKTVFPFLEGILLYPAANLFDYIHHSVRQTAALLGIGTPVVVSSTVQADHSLRGQARVVALCRAMGTTHYVNPIGGLELYAAEAFAEHGMTLWFIETRPIVYRQFGDAFVPNLSIVDVMMFNPVDAICGMLREFDLIPARGAVPG